MKAFEENIRAHFQFLDYAPIVFLSAKTKKRTQTLLPVINEVNESHSIRVQTNVLNDVIMDAVAMNPTPTHNGSRLEDLLCDTGCGKTTDICCVCKRYRINALFI